MNELAGLRDALYSAVTESIRQNQIQGSIGIKNDDGTYVVNHPNRPDFCYVTLGSSGQLGTNIARNIGGPRWAGYPVILERRGDELVVVGPDNSIGRMEAFRASNPVGSYGVAPHTHMIGTGLEYQLQALLFEPGRVLHESGMTVRARAFRYIKSDGTWETFEGGTIDLTAYAPGTVGHHAWVVVGINPATNTLAAATGTSVSTSTALTVGGIDGILTASYIALMAIDVHEDDTTLVDISRYWDARGWLGGSTASGADFVRRDGTTALTGDWNIGASRKLGIGTTPGAPLDVAGYVRISGNASAPTAGAGIEIFYNAGSAYGRIYPYDRGAAAYRAFWLDGSPLLLNTVTGANVGVGTGATSPPSPFFIKTSTNAGLRFDTIGSGAVVELSTDSSDGADAYSLLLMAGGYATSNYYKRGAYAQMFGNEFSGVPGVLRLGIGSAASWAELRDASNVQQMYMTAGGLFGWGNTNPRAKMDIAGIIRTTSNAGSMTSGAGIEFYYTTAGVIQAYDRDASSFKNLLIESSSLTINANSGGDIGGSWIGASFGTGWGNTGAGLTAVGYKKIGDLVFLRGNATRTSGVGTTVMTLPVGYRPSAAITFMNPMYLSSPNYGFTITSAGVVINTSATPSVVGFDGIVFSTL